MLTYISYQARRLPMKEIQGLS